MAKDHNPHSSSYPDRPAFLDTEMSGKTAAVHWLDWGIWFQPQLFKRLHVRLRVISLLSSRHSNLAYIGWGLKRSGRRARRLATQRGGVCWLLEDGFLRSMEGGGSPSHSLIVDDIGIYYDASRPSLLENLVEAPLTSDQCERARQIVGKWKDGGLSKYNEGRDPVVSELPPRYVLVVDQTLGDAAISAGNAHETDFLKMLEDALLAHPDCTVVVRIHPDVVAGRKRGHFDLSKLQQNSRVQVSADGSHPARWLAHAEAVYTVTSQLGFEALFWSKPVHVYGMPFYAGWGLTHDIQIPPHRRRPISLEQLVYGSLVRYVRYFDPESGLPCEIETLMAWVSLQRQQRQRFPRRLSAYGFSKWKRPFVRDFLSGSNLHFLSELRDCDSSDDTLVTWGHKHREELQTRGYLNQPILRIEDGFIRSVGLGADLIRPISWVIDPDGIYYDANSPSRLELILREQEFDQTILARAKALRQKIVKTGITKYNLHAGEIWVRPDNARKVVLVVGQVETDAAIRYGASTITRNMELLQAVRQARPDAWLLYKPHPDVKAGLREPGQGERDAGRWCDEIVGDVPIAQLLETIDELHVLTSLAGFEALLRHVPVVTWGLPFYAGWGLTQDNGMTADVLTRRGRSLSLDELVAGTLLMYPTYVSRITRNFCTPERAVDELLNWRKERRPFFLRRFVARLSRKP
ncbi:capsular polysaccharide biosynthesis protein [Achromobacter sp. RTa]|uniref:capsular polysaccharide biosynthesis protein n=1 Tax=Achromobacter sp. RTa TaxID=1532557 RepID=UPI0009E0AAFF|nr:capsular polysaccharide biosynthesis protein [Achromobacter sp. RTa]